MDIARCLGVNVAAVMRQVKEIQAGGIVVRVAEARDGRHSDVRLHWGDYGFLNNFLNVLTNLSRRLGRLSTAQTLPSGSSFIPIA